MSTLRSKVTDPRRRVDCKKKKEKKEKKEKRKKKRNMERKETHTHTRTHIHTHKIAKERKLSCTHVYIHTYTYAAHENTMSIGCSKTRFELAISERGKEWEVWKVFFCKTDGCAVWTTSSRCWQRIFLINNNNGIQDNFCSSVSASNLKIETRGNDGAWRFDRWTEDSLSMELVGRSLRVSTRRKKKTKRKKTKKNMRVTF